MSMIMTVGTACTPSRVFVGYTETVRAGPVLSGSGCVGPDPVTTAHHRLDRRFQARRGEGLLDQVVEAQFHAAFQDFLAHLRAT